MWPEVAYQSPLVESTRVIACSKPSSRASWLVKNSVERSCGAVSALMPQARMKPMRLGDAIGKRLVALAGGRAVQETERPSVDMLEIGIAAAGKGAQEVERRRRLPVGHDLAFGIGQPRLQP